MIRAGAGYSTAPNPRIAATEATRAAMQQAGLRIASAAFCFISAKFGDAYPLMLRIVRESAGTSNVVGCETIGAIANGREFESGCSIAVLVFDSDALSAKRFFVPQLRNRAIQAAQELAAAVRPHLASNNLLTIFADTYNLDAAAFVESISAELPGVALAGGGATEDGAIGETFQFCGDVVSSNAISAMLLAGDFDLRLDSALACTPVGPAHRITAVRDNVILELDGHSAYESFCTAAGPLADDPRRAAAFIMLGIPLSADSDRLERGNYYVRNIVGVSADHGAIAVAHRPKINDLVGFVLRNAERSRSELKAMLERLAGAARKPPSFGLYFDCVSRGSGLYNLPDHDSAYISQQFAGLPVAGFFTGFEFGPLANLPGLLQYSGVLTLIAEQG